MKHFNVFIYVKYNDICYHIIAMENQNDNKNLTEFIVDEIKPIEGFEKVEIKKKKKNPYLKLFIRMFDFIIIWSIIYKKISLS